MEPVGFAVGIIGLAGLFSTCLDVLDKVDSWKDFGIDSRNLSAQFKAHKLRLERWGKAVGFENGGVSDVHDKTLDDPHILSAVKDLLTVVKDVCHIEDDVFSPSEFTPDMTGKHVLPRRHTRLDMGKGPKMQKLNWALRDKAKRVTQVGNFAALVDILYSLVPVGGERGINGSLENQDGETFDRAAFNAQLVDIVSKIQSEMEAETKRDMHMWLLGGHLPNETYERSTERRIDGTCEWILSTPWFQDWQSSDFPSDRPKVLWLNAPAGFGKSILCARVVDHLSSTLKQPTCNFFFSTDLEREDHFVAIRNWLSQMISHPTAYGLIHELWSAQQGVKATRHEITNLLRDVARAVPGCTFSLDGLDECIRRAEHQEDSIAGFINTVRCATAGTPTRLLIVSRDEPEIRGCLSEMEDILFVHHKITPDDVQADIDIYSRSVVDRKLAKKTETIRLDISKQLSERCNGQFLWIKLQENDLRSTANQKALQRIINSTPVGLEDAYQRNWKRISQLSDEYRTRAFNILRWAAFAVRPLTVNEMAGALLVAEENDEVLLEEIPYEIDEDYIEIEILKDCNSLLEIRTPQAEFSAGMKTIHLAHFSVKEYLLQVLYIPSPSQGLRLNPMSQLSVDGIQGILLGKMCLQYLNCQAVWDSTTEEYQLLSYFRNYAAESWQQHSVDNTKDAQLTKLIHNFFDEKNPAWIAWKEWFDSNHTDGNWEMEDDAKSLPTSAGPMWYAAYLGMRDVVQSFLRTSNDGIEGKGIGGLTALGVACSEGHLEIARMLLNAGADVQNATNKGEILLSFAIGNLEVAKLLLDNGADIEAADRNGWTALHLSCHQDQLEVFRLLLEGGADIEAVSKYGTTALITACREGHLDAVRLLLETGANIDAADEDRWTALITACRNGHLEVVWLLLDTGADIEAADENGRTALITACRGSNLEAVRLLLDTGANIEAADKYGLTALITACSESHLDAVRVLLETGANIDATDEDGWTALITACRNGHLEVVRLLLDNGADTTAVDTTGFNALIAASFKGHLEVVKLLLDNGVKIQSSNEWGRTALFYAASWGQKDVIRLFLANDISLVDLSDTWGSTPLFAAAKNGHSEVVLQLILVSRLTVSSKDNLGKSLFYWAKRSGSSEVVNILLQHAESNGVEIPKAELEMEISSVSSDKTTRYCDSCVRYMAIGDSYRQCSTCYDDFCVECFDLGARCLDPDHEMALQEPDVLADNDNV
ncbi:hypothetical protein N7490_011619 [Penicillium lividum]|nr:hypothetical protein N7490_011619 [Penicillium lividum]